MKSQRGSVVLWFALMAPFLIAVVGLATDAGYLYDRRQHLQDVADDAARTGAEQLDAATYYRQQVVVLDPSAARAAALAYLADIAPGDAADVQAAPQDVAVSLHEQVPLPFLRAVGIASASVGARSVAAPMRNGR